MKKIYPAIFQYAEDGGFYVEFPDLEGCLSEGDTLEEAIDMATEALGLYLASNYERGIAVNSPSEISVIDNSDGFVNYVSVDISKYMKNTKAVKKTLTIPEWLNQKAEKAGINFSATLQDSLRRQLDL